MPSILSEHNRSRLLAVERPTRRVQSRLIVVVASSPQSVGYQSRWELPCHYLDLVPLTLFPEFADMEV